MKDCSSYYLLFFLNEFMVVYVIQETCLFYMLITVLVYLFIAFPQFFSVCWGCKNVTCFSTYVANFYYLFCLSNLGRIY